MPRSPLVAVDSTRSGGDPAWLSARAQIKLFRAGSLSPVEVLTAQIERIEQHGQTLNALTYDHFEEARQAARESERRYREGRARTLDGITVAIKDEYAKAGWIVTAGSKLFESDVKHSNHPVIEKLLQAGAVLHAQTTVPELYLLAVTWSDLWGVTCNPWNLTVTPGGSSGGSAAMVAAGMSTTAIGSDMGGSIRVPSALNGLYGSKPSYGRIASADPSALVPHASPGPLARHLPDLSLLQNVMMGPAAGCPAVLRPKLDLPAEYQFVPRRLAFNLDQDWARLEPDVRAGAIVAAQTFERAGFDIEEVTIPLETSDEKVRETIEKALFSTVIGGSLLELKPRREELTRYGRRFLELADSLCPRDANAAAAEAFRLYKIIEEHVFAKGFDALITPTVTTTAIPASFDPTRDQLMIDGAQVDPYAGWFLTSVFSLVNWMPVINVPAGRAENGVPIGLQIVTPPYEDFRCYQIAASYFDTAEPLPFDSALDL